MYDFAGKVQRQSSRCTLTFLARISLGKVWHKSSILEPVTDNPLWTISDARMDDGNPCCRHTMNLPGRLIAWSQTTGHTKGDYKGVIPKQSVRPMKSLTPAKPRGGGTQPAFGRFCKSVDYGEPHGENKRPTSNRSCGPPQTYARGVMPPAGPPAIPRLRGR